MMRHTALLGLLERIVHTSTTSLDRDQSITAVQRLLDGRGLVQGLEEEETPLGTLAERVQAFLMAYRPYEITTATLIPAVQAATAMKEVKKLMLRYGWKPKLVWQDTAPHKLPRVRGYARKRRMEV